MAGFRVGPETVVTLEYEVFDADGERVGGSEGDEPLRAVVGYGELLPAIERALDGLETGSRRSVALAPKDAYGRRDPSRVLEVDLGEFPADVAAGDRYEVDTDSGERLILRVLNVSEDAVVVDANHPLAGQRVRFELHVLDVRPATEDELHQATVRLEAAEHAGTGGDVEPGSAGPPALVPPERLILRGRRLNGGRLPTSEK
jgi:FKBP-type peptidyl-prolyl cis-trans isomerase SlyD